MENQKEKKIKVLQNGPYEVTGNIPLNGLRFVPDKEGASESYEETIKYPRQESYHLCRCGGSSNKPFCDGSHYVNGFDGKETASHKTYDEMATYIEGKVVDLLDAEELCAVARFCDTNGTTWDLINNSKNPHTENIVKQQCNDCPSGRLTAVTKDGKRIEPVLSQEVSILEDEDAQVHGPIWVKGGISIEDGEGLLYPVRNRVTLCRCGKSQNKPFCDARHMQNEGELLNE